MGEFSHCHMKINGDDNRGAESGIYLFELLNGERDDVDGSLWFTFKSVSVASCHCHLFNTMLFY